MFVSVNARYTSGFSASIKNYVRTINSFATSRAASFRPIRLVTAQYVPRHKNDANRAWQSFVIRHSTSLEASPASTTAPAARQLPNSTVVSRVPSFRALTFVYDECLDTQNPDSLPHPAYCTSSFPSLLPCLRLPGLRPRQGLSLTA